MATFPHNYKSNLPKCVIRVDNEMYDLTAWRDSHPGGAELLDLYHNADATDVFYAFHSQEAIAQLKRWKGKPATEKDPKRDEVSLAYEKFRKQLEKDGWFQRNWFLDFFRVLLPIFTLYAIGWKLAPTYPVLAVLFIGVGMQQAGWAGHDYSHGRGKACRILDCLLGGIMNGFSTSWWSHKHNTHHAFPNRLGVDSDVHNEPILHLFFPKPENDVWHRKYQHIYYMGAYAFLYASWRLQSIIFVFGSRNWLERTLLIIGYGFLATLPWKVLAGSILFGGWLVAIVVTANHQPEKMLEDEDPYNYVADQYITTRGVITSNPITEYLFGGMQYQLEHHLFPTMPRYYYGKLRPLCEKFAKENNLPYKMSPVMEIMKLNYETMKKYAQESPKGKKN